MSDRQVEPLAFGGETIYIEVVEGNIDGQDESSDGYEETDATERLAEVGDRVRSTISALATTVREALSYAEPDEWSLEVNIGFKGKAGIPFVSEGEANGAVKVTAKWKKD